MKRQQEIQQTGSIRKSRKKPCFHRDPDDGGQFVEWLLDQQKTAVTKLMIAAMLASAKGNYSRVNSGRHCDKNDANLLSYIATAFAVRYKHVDSPRVSRSLVKRVLLGEDEYSLWLAQQLREAMDAVNSWKKYLLLCVLTVAELDSISPLSEAIAEVSKLSSQILNEIQQDKNLSTEPKEWPQSIKGDRKLMACVCYKYPWVLQFVSDRLKDDTYFVRHVVKSEHLAQCDETVLQYASERLKDTTSIVEAAVTAWGDQIIDASERLNRDPDVLLLALQDDGMDENHAWEYAGESARAQLIEAWSVLSDMQINNILYPFEWDPPPSSASKTERIKYLNKNQYYLQLQELPRGLPCGEGKDAEDALVNRLDAHKDWLDNKQECSRNCVNLNKSM